MSNEDRIRVLIVEDQEVVRLGLKLVLKGLSDIEVIGEAADGFDAVRLAEELKPDVILMDLRMPNLDGIEASKQIHESQPATRIVVLTSHDRDEDVFAALAVGADGYCLKNSPGEQIALAVKSVHAGAVWLDPAIGTRVLQSCTASAKPANFSAPRVNKQAGLTERELEVLRHVVDGLSNGEIAERLHLSQETIKTHMRHIMEKLMVSDRTQAAVKALRQGYI